jgi:hypothetical protein
MNVLVAALFALFAIPLVHADDHNHIYYHAKLAGSQSSGLANITLDKNHFQLNLTIIENLVGDDAITDTNQVVGIHIHKGNETESGPIVWSFCGADPLPACKQSGDGATYQGAPFGSYTVETASQLLLDGIPTYAAFHTTNVPQGLMRGQVEKNLLQEPLPPASAHQYYYSAHLANELTESSGQANIILETFKLTFTISEDLVGDDAITETNKVIGIHIHKGNETESGPIVWTLCGADPAPACQQSSSETTYEGFPYGDYSAETASMLLLDGIPTYVNFHTNNNQSGLLRGQIVKTFEEI